MLLLPDTDLIIGNLYDHISVALKMLDEPLTPQYWLLWFRDTHLNVNVNVNLHVRKCPVLENVSLH